MNSVNITLSVCQEKAATFNKSRAIIDGLISSDQKVWGNVLSYESEYGIYKVLAKVFHSFAGEDFKENEDVHSVEELAGWLMSMGKFSASKLSEIKAVNDGSFFRWVKEMAINAIKDSRRKHYIKFTELDDARKSTCSKANFEERDMLEKMMTQAKLCAFQEYIIQHYDLEGYSPEEIVKMYGAQNNRTYTMNYYYSQRSKALSSLSKIARTA